MRLGQALGRWTVEHFMGNRARRASVGIPRSTASVVAASWRRFGCRGAPAARPSRAKRLVDARREAHDGFAEFDRGEGVRGDLAVAAPDGSRRRRCAPARPVSVRALSPVKQDRDGGRPSRPGRGSCSSHAATGIRFHSSMAASNPCPADRRGLCARPRPCQPERPTCPPRGGGRRDGRVGGHRHRRQDRRGG
jgi:hypothetical protein